LNSGTLKPNEGRLQTAEHILCKVLEGRANDAVMGISKFKEDSGLLEITTAADARTFDLGALQDEVNAVISKGLPVHKTVKKREDAEKEVDLRKVPQSVTEVMIVDIERFDKRPCRDPHVGNTSQIGKFVIRGVEKAGSNRYRFTFKVEF